MKKSIILFAAILMLGTVSFAQKGEKLSVDEIVAKHLASIGTPEDLAAAKTRVFTGEGNISSRIKTGNSVSGPVQFASKDYMVLLAIAFNSDTYPYDKAAYDGKNQSVGLPNGKPTQLSKYLNAHNSILKYGYFGGALSTAWPLYDLKARKVKLDSSGLTKIDGKPVYKLKASPGNELRLAMYFDAETFRHVRTEYEYVVLAGMQGGGSTNVAAQKQDNYKMIEDFADFRPAGKLTLPYSYTINIEAVIQSTGAGTISPLWQITFKDMLFDQTLDASMFKVS